MKYRPHRQLRSSNRQRQSVPVVNFVTYAQRSFFFTAPQLWFNFLLHPLKVHANGRNKSQHCCVLLGIFGQQCCVRLHGPKSLTSFKIYATSANKFQHCCDSMQTDAISWAHATVLRVVGQQCCVRLHGP